MPPPLPLPPLPAPAQWNSPKSPTSGTMAVISCKIRNATTCDTGASLSRRVYFCSDLGSRDKTRSRREACAASFVDGVGGAVDLGGGSVLYWRDVRGGRSRTVRRATVFAGRHSPVKRTPAGLADHADAEKRRPTPGNRGSDMSEGCLDTTKGIIDTNWATVLCCV
ncbi:uncharacterized protein SPSK_09942 [Sporothrix schenckii 1099-18]|uniref:Uncharacterized protein n=1 Tax=Sporothrix schenckii 1099-18 TaxID=1397361 RepID=A0A0F2M5R1_SPOSC|nr:uncharacterized protein SPSK_09942 [Sporothrix schenckii 1099-18]KJR85038.1 hypothetical protein SPSK_09942 [Sporothrix schenckii 1099-18]